MAQPNSNLPLAGFVVTCDTHGAPIKEFLPTTRRHHCSRPPGRGKLLKMQGKTWGKNMESTGGTPSHHPFLDGMFH